MPPQHRHPVCRLSPYVLLQQYKAAGGISCNVHGKEEQRMNLNETLCAVGTLDKNGDGSCREEMVQHRDSASQPGKAAGRSCTDSGDQNRHRM